MPATATSEPPIADTARADDLLPIGLSDGCVLRRDVKQDGVVRFSDVSLPRDRLVDRLWDEQLERFPIAA